MNMANFSCTTLPSLWVARRVQWSCDCPTCWGGAWESGCYCSWSTWAYWVYGYCFHPLLRGGKYYSSLQAPRNHKRGAFAKFSGVCPTQKSPKHVLKSPAPLQVSVLIKTVAKQHRLGFPDCSAFPPRFSRASVPLLRLLSRFLFMGLWENGLR